jgi:uncharacterized protein YpiB (UPF0302 family)
MKDLMEPHVKTNVKTKEAVKLMDVVNVEMDGLVLGVIYIEMNKKAAKMIVIIHQLKKEGFALEKDVTVIMDSKENHAKLKNEEIYILSIFIDIII